MSYTRQLIQDVKQATVNYLEAFRAAEAERDQATAEAQAFKDQWIREEESASDQLQRFGLILT